MSRFKNERIILREIITRNPSSQRFSYHEWLTFSVILGYLLLECYWLFNRFGSHLADLTLYHKVAVKVFSGQMPFRDFELEYPLFALIPMLVPQLFNVITANSFQGYVFWFVVENLALGGIIGYLVLYSKTSDGRATFYHYLILLIFSFPIFLFRFDAFSALFVSIAIYYLSQNQAVAGASLMVSIGAKLYSLVILPSIVLFYFFNQKYNSLVKFLAGGFIIFVAYFICLFLLSDNPLGFLNNHVLRGIHLESLAGGILLLFHKAGLTSAEIVFNYGAFHLETRWSADAVSIIKIMTPLGFVAITGYTMWIFRREKSQTGSISLQSLMIVISSHIVLFIVINKVFSPQYMVWLLPLIPFCGNRAFLIFTAALMLTIFIFPGTYGSLLSRELYMIIILNVRNFLLVGLLIELLSKLRSRDYVH